MDQHTNRLIGEKETMSIQETIYIEVNCDSGVSDECEDCIEVELSAIGGSLEYESAYKHVKKLDWSVIGSETVCPQCRNNIEDDGDLDYDNDFDND